MFHIQIRMQSKSKIDWSSRLASHVPLKASNDDIRSSNPTKPIKKECEEKKVVMEKVVYAKPTKEPKVVKKMVVSKSKEKKGQ